nr:MAG TPA: hypothetical protein [Caudoviricetes sp.]
MVRRKEECVERINLEKERVDYEWIIINDWSGN